jgi:hypothetical protein
MADTIEIIQGTATTVEVAGPTGPQGPAGAAGATGAQGPQGVPGTGLEVLTTQGDLLYQGASTGQRLPIGTTGQVLKVSGGIPAWGAESGAVSSVAGKTGAVTLDKNDVGLGNVANTAQVTSVTGTAPIVSSGGTTPAISISAATQSAAGSMSSADKIKLDGVASGAEVNVQSNWTEADSGSDAFILNKPASFTPSLHGSTHHTGGTDVLTPSDIGAQSLFTSEGIVLTANVTLASSRAKKWSIQNYNGTTYSITLPTTGVQQGDVIVITTGTLVGSQTIREDIGGGAFVGLVTISEGQSYRFVSEGTSSSSWVIDPVYTHTHTGSQVNVGTTANLPLKTGTNGVIEAGSFGTAAGSFCAGDDARLSDARTPSSTLAHAASHAAAGSDPVFDQDLNTTNDVEFNQITINGIVATSGIAGSSFPLNNEIRVADLGSDNYADFVAIDNLTGNRAYQLPDADGTLALQGAITTSGLTQATARILGRTTASTGAVEEITVGSGLSLSAGELSSTVSAGIPATLLDAKGDLIVASAADTAARLAVGGTNGHVLTVDSAETLGVKWAAAAGGVGGGTGSTDNSILRSDGTGGGTLQDSALVIDDATTSTQANVALANNHSETNSSLVLRPKGNGAFILLKPDGTAANGNARGQFAVDLQLETSAATRVASGNYSFAVGRRCTASGLHSVAIGEQCLAGSASYTISLGRAATASSNGAICLSGDTCTASGQETFVAGGNQNTASASSSMTLGGDYAVSDRGGMVAQANGRFAANGDAQWIHIVLRAKTTTNAAVELLINSARVTNGRLTCPSGKIISGIINIHGVKSDGTASAHYVRQFQVKNVAGTSSYPYAAVTIGTDFASSTSITFNDPDANGDALSVSVTGIASETWRWTAHVSAVETAYGT